MLTQHKRYIFGINENSLDHRVKYFEQLKDTPIHPCVCCHRLCFRKQVVKKYKTTIEKYRLHIPTNEIKPLLCKTCYSFFQKNKTLKLLVPINIKYVM
jgi:RNase P subunit RPR2